MYDIQGKCVDIMILDDMNELFIRTNHPGLLLEWGSEILIVENWKVYWTMFCDKIGVQIICIGQVVLEWLQAFTYMCTETVS